MIERFLWWLSGKDYAFEMLFFASLFCLNFVPIAISAFFIGAWAAIPAAISALAWFWLLMPHRVKIEVDNGRRD